MLNGWGQGAAGGHGTKHKRHETGERKQEPGDRIHKGHKTSHVRTRNRKHKKHEMRDTRGKRHGT